MKNFFIIFFFCYCFSPAQAQLEWIESPDSVKHIINTTKDDTFKVWRLNNLAVLYVYNNPDTGLKYSNQMLKLAQRLNYEDGVAASYGVISSAYNTLGNYPLAIHNAFEAIKIYNKKKDTLSIAHMHDVLAEIYSDLGDYKTALTYEYKSRRIVESWPDSFYAGGNWQVKKQALMYSDAGLSSEYLLANRPDSALLFAKRAFAVDRELNLFWSYTPLILGNAFLKLNELDSALKYYRSPIRIHAQNDEIDIKIGIAAVFKKNGQIDSSIYYAKTALDSAQAIHYTKAIMTASELLSLVHEKTNPAEAIRYFKINIAAKDSLYNREKVNEISSIVFGEERRSRDLQEAQLNYKNRLWIFGLITLASIFLIIGIILYRNNLHKQNAKTKIEKAYTELKSAQAQLIQSEKMASLGELTAGIAHEIQNPLNFVNNFSDVSRELIDELKSQKSKLKSKEQDEILNDIDANLEKINHHGKRADAIVKNMLQHSRSSSSKKELTDINTLADEYLRLSYHGFRAKDNSFNTTIKTDFDESVGSINIIPQDIGRVLLNLYNNAFYAVNEKKKTADDMYQPSVSVSTKGSLSIHGEGRGEVIISVKDNGNGIPQNITDKIFQPFFTTKPTGQGTGLGLSLSYDIIKAHGGEITVESEDGEGTTFIIQLPSNSKL